MYILICFFDVRVRDGGREMVVSWDDKKEKSGSSPRVCCWWFLICSIVSLATACESNCDQNCSDVMSVSRCTNLGFQLQLHYREQLRGDQCWAPWDFVLVGIEKAADITTRAIEHQHLHPCA